MKRPTAQTMMMGHPVIAIPIMLAASVVLFAAYQDSNALMGLIAIAMLGAVLRATEQVGAYRTWKAQWDAMAEDPPQRSYWLRRILGVGLVAALILLAASDPITVAGLVGALAGYTVGWVDAHPMVLLALAGLVAVILLIRWIRHRPIRTAAAAPVTVVAKPILPVPPLQQAFAALPDHCKRLT